MVNIGQFNPLKNGGHGRRRRKYLGDNDKPKMEGRGKGEGKKNHSVILLLYTMRTSSWDRNCEEKGGGSNPYLLVVKGEEDTRTDKIACGLSQGNFHQFQKSFSNHIRLRKTGWARCEKDIQLALFKVWGKRVDIILKKEKKGQDAGRVVLGKIQKVSSLRMMQGEKIETTTRARHTIGPENNGASRDRNRRSNQVALGCRGFVLPLDVVDGWLKEGGKSLLY